MVINTPLPQTNLRSLAPWSRKRLGMIPGYALAYLDHLIGRYRQSGASFAVADEIIRRSETNPKDLTWGDVFLLERLLIAILDKEEVVRSLWAMRFRLKQIAGDEAYEAYDKSSLPSTANVKKCERIRNASWICCIGTIRCFRFAIRYE